MKKLLPIILSVVITAAASSGITYFVTVNSVESGESKDAVVDIVGSENSDEDNEEGKGSSNLGYELSGGQETVTGSSSKNKVSIKSAHIAKNYADEDVVVITYEYSRLSGEAKSFDSAFWGETNVYQNGVALEPTYSLSDDEVEEAIKYNSQSVYNDVKAGYTADVTIAYKLKNKTDNLVVEAVESTYSSNYSVSRTFTIK